MAYRESNAIGKPHNYIMTEVFEVANPPGFGVAVDAPELQVTAVFHSADPILAEHAGALWVMVLDENDKTTSKLTDQPD